MPSWRGRAASDRRPRLRRRARGHDRAAARRGRGGPARPSRSWPTGSRSPAAPSCAPTSCRSPRTSRSAVAIRDDDAGARPRARRRQALRRLGGAGREPLPLLARPHQARPAPGPHLRASEIHIHAWSLFGDIDLLVPEGVPVEVLARREAGPCQAGGHRPGAGRAADHPHRRHDVRRHQDPPQAAVAEARLAPAQLSGAPRADRPRSRPIGRGIGGRRAGRGVTCR